LRLVLGPAAFGSAESLWPYVAGLRARGVDAIAIELPRGRAERAAAAFRPFTGLAIGGHSFGGRAASLAAAGGGFAALVCFSFPLAGRAQERTAHFDRIACPALIVNGDRDRLAPLPELAPAARRLRSGRLVVIPGAGHRLGGLLDGALDAAAEFLHSVG